MRPTGWCPRVATLYSPDYVRRMILIATSARHSTWCISWGETVAIYPTYEDGYY